MPSKNKKASNIFDEVNLCDFNARSKARSLMAQALQLSESSPERLALLQEASNYLRSLGKDANYNEFLECLCLIVMQLIRIQKFEAAVIKSKELLKNAIDVGDSTWELTALKMIGNTYIEQRKYQAAKDIYQRALSIAEQRQSVVDRLVCFNRLGRISELLGLPKDARACHIEHLRLSRRIKKTDEESNAILNLGNTYQMEGDYKSAICCFRRSLLISQRIGIPLIEAYSLCNLGVIAHLLGKEKEAICKQEKVLEISESTKSSDLMLKALGNLGTIYESMGHYQKAKDYYEQVLLTSQKLSRIDDEIACYGNLGNIAKRMGQYDLALIYHNRVLDFRRRNGDFAGQARSLNNLGITHRLKQELDKAISHYNECLQLCRTYNYRAEEAKTLINLGNVYLDSGNYKEALALLKVGKDAMRELGQLPGELYALGGLSRAYYELEKYDMAFKYSEEQVALASKLDSRAIEKDASTNLGYYFFRSGDFEKAETILRKALTNWDVLWSSLKSDVDRTSILDLQMNIYFLLQEVLVSQEKYEEALEIAEQGRAKSLLRMLTKQIRSYSTHLGGNLKLKEDTTPVNINEIRKIARQHNSILVEYSVVYSHSLYIWVVSPSGEINFRYVNFRSLQNGDALQDEELSIREIAIEFHHAISQRSWTGDADYYSKKLYEYLIKPVKEFLPENINTLVTFIPHHELLLIPFTALYSSNASRFLVEECTVSVAPSIGTLALTQLRKQRISTEVSNNFTKPLVVGNPTMPVNPLSKPPEQLDPLPFAEKEAQEIAKLLNTKALIGDAATKMSVLEQLSQANIIHLATHGLLDITDESKIPGAIALASTSNDDGLLMASEILELKLNAELVVLSACNTGLGDLRNEGIIGLSRCLFLAGTPSIVASLWEVSDISTAELMIKFYQNLQKTASKAQALCDAMRSLLHRNPPLNWAAFVLIGEA